jgi:hypothetical protein
MRFAEAHWTFWQREIDAPQQQAQHDVEDQAWARRMYWRFVKRLNHRQQRQERRQGRRR